MTKLLEKDEKADHPFWNISSNQYRNQTVINESGLYEAIFGSQMPKAKEFKRWVKRVVLPSIRKSGSFSSNSPGHVFGLRAMANEDKIEAGYFSVIGELYLRFHLKFEYKGYVLKDNGLNGQEVRPDVSVGRLFAKWLRDNHPEEANNFKMYPHKFPSGLIVEARQYKMALLERFILFVQTVWSIERAPAYLKDRDPAALAYLPKTIAVTK
jgi:hypothetical protein